MKSPFTPEGDLWILSANGTAYWPDKPIRDNIDISVIAQSLSQKVRFGGHGRPFYSVAQHVILVRNLVEQIGPRDGYSPYVTFQASRHALVHDAHEAWLVDLPSPLKKQPYIRRWWSEMEDRWDNVIFDVLDIEDNDRIRSLVKKADLVAMRLEGLHIMPATPDDWEWPGHGASTPEIIELAEEFKMVDGSPGRGVWDWERAEEEFLNAWMEFEKVIRAEVKND